jgi:hypothetical protein
MMILHHGSPRHPDPVAALDGNKPLPQLLLKSIKRIAADILHGLPQLVPGNHMNIPAAGM